jgi:GT2 family glycosyltransferase
MRFHERFVESMVPHLTRDPDVFSVDAVQFDWAGSNKVHLATSLRHAGIRGDQLVPGLYVCQGGSNRPTPALMSSAANLLARKSMFRDLGGFDERLPMGYEDIELCWRAWIRGWKTIFAPPAICWHRVGHSSRSAEGARMRLRGTIAGRLLMATKLLPIRYVITTWLVSLLGLAADLGRLRWQSAWDRIRVFSDYARYLSPLVHERGEVYRAAHTSPTEQLERLLRLAAA